jgi:parvulin-like peptidyl-prolyl isomerase
VKIEQIYQRLKAGEDFVTIASQLSEDPGSKMKGGSLGWFTKGAMVKEFEDACMNGKVGEIQAPIKTQFGFHIIKVNAREKRLFRLVDIKKTVKASTKTIDAVRKRAEDFVYITRKGNYEEEAQKINMKPVEIPPITKTSYVPGVGQSKALVIFAFKESKGSISDPIKIQQGYAVYLITDKIPAGYITFDSLKSNALTQKVKLEKKLDVMKQQSIDIRNKITNNDINSLKAFNPQIVINNADSISVAKPNPQIGNDFDFDNAVFKLQNGQISDPIRTARGYYIVQMRSITPFDQNKFMAQSETIKTTLINAKKQSIVQDWIAALKEKASIVDNRDKFFR